MTSVQFCFWLQGFFELRKENFPQLTGNAMPAGSLTSEQANCIERHLSLVFKHEIDPSQGPLEHQAQLQNIHDGTSHMFGKTDSQGNVARC